MTPAEALRNILSLVDGSDEMEDVHALQILLQSIKTLAEKGLGRSERDRGRGHEPGIKNRMARTRPARSGHDVATDRPALVTAAVRTMVDAVSGHR
jgi:hypothetical protein